MSMDFRRTVINFVKELVEFVAMFQLGYLGLWDVWAKIDRDCCVRVGQSVSEAEMHRVWLLLLILLLDHIGLIVLLTHESNIYLDYNNVTV